MTSNSSGQANSESIQQPLRSIKVRKLATKSNDKALNTLILASNMGYNKVVLKRTYSQWPRPKLNP